MFQDQRFFQDPFPFFKGNLHCHSQVSDGKFSRREIVERYKQHGYSFLAFSDHEKFVVSSELETPDFITLPAVEWATDHVCGDIWMQTHHIHGIMGTQEMLRNAKKEPLHSGDSMPRLSWRGKATVKEMAAYFRERGNFCIYNHPVWSRTEPVDFGDLDGFTALEIYNHGCNVENHTGYADLYWDHLLSQGVRIHAVATDDNHNKGEAEDSFGGWIMVQAPELSRDSLVENILSGNYYSSTGPQIYEYGIVNGTAYVTCSGVHHINFIAGGYVCAGYCKWSQDGENSLTHAEYTPQGPAGYIRIECVDKFGKIAWSNPLYEEMGPNT